MAALSSHKENKFSVALQNIAVSNGFVNYKIKINDDRVVADGYVGKINEAEIVAENETLYLILKSCSTDDKIRTIIPVETIFKREAYMYRNVFPLFSRFEIEKGLIPLEFSPKYYDSCSNKECDALILNNLNKIGFSIYRKDFFDDDHLKLVIRQYAQFHAISLAYKEQHPSEFKALVEVMEDITVKMFIDGGFLEVFANNLKKALTAADSQLEQGAKNAFQNFTSNLEKYVLSMSSFNDEYSVVLHGDCWKNNMMFKYQNEDKSVPVEVRMFDYQLSRPSSPMLDFANFFYASGSMEALDNMQFYLELYYNTLSAHLHALGSDSKKMYPRSVMLEHWKKCALYGLMIRTMVFNVVFSDENERKGISDALVEDTDLINVFNYKTLDMVKYTEHCKHTIMHFYENQFI